MAAAPEIVLVDDGELEDVRSLFDELGFGYTRWTKGRVPAKLREPRCLLVITAVLAATLQYRRLPGRDIDRPVWIAVAESESRSQRRLISESGFDYLLRRPVHPSALRMLLQRALYRGEDQRRRQRVAVGYQVSYKVGLLKRPATLVDLGPAGCRLLTRHAVKIGAKLSIQFPAAIAETAFTHGGMITRKSPGEAEGGQPGETSIGVRFDSFDAMERRRMLQLLNRLCAGPATLPEPVEPREHERQPRGAYDTEVQISGMEECVLVGRDLSPGGIRVDPHPALTIGAQIRLAIAGTGDEPVVVDAEVIRDDGELGTALRFRGLVKNDELRLIQLVEGLPTLESATESGVAQGVVLTQLLPAVLRNARRF